MHSKKIKEEKKNDVLNQLDSLTGKGLAFSWPLLTELHTIRIKFQLIVGKKAQRAKCSNVIGLIFQLPKTKLIVFLLDFDPWCRNPVFFNTESFVTSG